MGDGIAEGLYFLPGLVDLGKRHTGGGCLFLQAAEFLLGFNNLTLQGVILVLSEITIFQLLLGLSLCLLQRFQFVGGSADRILQRTLLLRKQLGVGRVKLEEAIYILQLALRIADRGINAL